jgi:N-acetylmuramoyl-L-alanine amidase CwlA
MVKIEQMLLTNTNRPKKKLKKLKKIIIHWTANKGKGANARANRNYFNNTTRACSAHYIVDEKEIVQCVPDNEVAYHVGANAYMPEGKKIIEGVYSPNYFTIGIEICVNSDGDFNKTYQNTVDLVATLLKKHKLKIEDILTHNLITGKDCPKFMLKESELKKFRDAVKKAILTK